MREISLHLLDIAENSVTAGASRIKLNLTEAHSRDRLYLSVIDNGKGIPGAILETVKDPFTSSRSNRKVGMGLPLLNQAASQCEGELSVRSRQGEGTQVWAEFCLSHIDRMPVGDLAATYTGLVLGHEDCNWVLRYQVDRSVFYLDDTQIKNEMDGIPLSEPAITSYLRNSIEKEIQNVSQKREEGVLMPEIKSFEDLKRLREEAIRLKEMRDPRGKTEVVVSMGTIGIAAGARETVKAILAFIEQKGLRNIIVRQTDSMGFEGSDPVVQVQLAEGEKVTYAKVNAAAVQRIMQDHVCDGKVVEDLQMVVSETEKSG